MTTEELRKQAEQMGYVLAKKKRTKRKGNAINRQAVIDACLQSINIPEAVDRIMDLPSVKQEPIIDKIRAEIEMYEADCILADDSKECKECDKIVFGSIYRIIDKYRKEQE